MAADREVTCSLVKILLTWRATVLSLMTRSEAISRLVLPVATRARISTSRPVSPSEADEGLTPRDLLHGSEIR